MPGFPEGLTGFRKLIADWGRFIDIDIRSNGRRRSTPLMRRI
jgi:hypothetical protein